MRFEVPQFIDVEDKIFGPFTWKQFLYLGGGVGMGVVLLLTTNFVVFLLVGLPVMLIALALAFYTVNNRPFSFFLEAMFNYVTRKRMYFWQRKETIVYRDHKVRSNDAPTTPVQVKNTDISSMARNIELAALEDPNLGDNTNINHGK